MENWNNILIKFIIQSQTDNLKFSEYPKEYKDFILRVSFGMGMPARVSWIAFITPEMKVSNGMYPVYLYYKDMGILILAYGISETNEFEISWPDEIISKTQTITSYLDRSVPRYGESYVFKVYQVNINEKNVNITYRDTNYNASEKDIEKDLRVILSQYSKILSLPFSAYSPELNSGLFYMENQLEDFIIHNWKNTELGKKYNLIIEDGVLLSQQYRTDIGNIDILVTDKSSNGYVVIELKKNQTSDDTVGQLAIYMGWIKEEKNTTNVKGIIIAGSYDKRLYYALKMLPNAEVFIYEVNFKLTEFKK